MDTSSQDEGGASSDPEQVRWPWLKRIPFLKESLRKFPKVFEKLSAIASHAMHYIIVVVVGCAAWQSHTPVTIITPFQVPKDLPFSGEIVADALQDGLVSVHDEITRESSDPRLKPADMDQPVVRDLNSPKFSTVQDPTRFAVEVNGMSYERIISAARTIRRNETIISGDVVLNGNDKEIVLIARTPGGGPWRSIPSPATAEGLKRASRDLAVKILESQDATLAAAALLKDGQIERAVAALDRAQSEQPTETRILNLCMGYEASHRYAAAVECYGRVHKLNPDSNQVFAQLAHAQYLIGERDDAIMNFDKLAHQRQYVPALIDLGKAREDTGDHAGALKAYDEFLAKQSGNCENRDHNLALAYLNKGAALSHAGSHEEAIEVYKLALQRAPDDVLVLVNLAVETAAKGDIEGGIAQLRSVIEDNVNLDSIPFAHVQLGNLLQQQHDWQGAIEQFREATELRPSYDMARRSLAYSLAHNGLTGYALAEYVKVARLSPVDVDRRYSQVLGYQWLGNTLKEQGDDSGAISAYREAIKLKHDYRAAHYQLALLLERRRQIDQAVREYRAAALPNPKELDENETVRLAQLHLGEELVSQGRAHRAEGIAELRKLMELDLKNLECRFCLAKALLDEGNFVEAATEYRSAIRFEPQSAAAHNGLGLALDKQGLVDYAMTEYRQAVNLDPGNAIYHANLARALNLQHLNHEAAAERGLVAKLNVPGIVARDHAQQYVPCQHLP
jgi:tetratricopeptide (TPR) repeat protein